jgi:hypothetical protein
MSRYEGRRRKEEGEGRRRKGEGRGSGQYTDPDTKRIYTITNVTV